MKIMLSGVEHAQPTDGIRTVLNGKERTRCTYSYQESNMDPPLMPSQGCSEDNMKILQSGWEHGSPTDGIDYLLRTSRERERDGS